MLPGGGHVFGFSPLKRAQTCAITRFRCASGLGREIAANMTNDS